MYDRNCLINLNGKSLVGGYLKVSGGEILWFHFTVHVELSYVRN